MSIDGEPWTTLPAIGEPDPWMLIFRAVEILDRMDLVSVREGFALHYRPGRASNEPLAVALATIHQQIRAVRAILAEAEGGDDVIS